MFSRNGAFSMGADRMLFAVVFLIVLVWAICASVMAGMGSLVLQKLSVEWNISDAFWIGLCTAVVVLQLYHFFRPIDNLIVVLLCTLGVLGVILNRNALVRLIRRVSGMGLWPGFAYITPVLVIAVRCAGPVFYYDTGLYGAMAVRWFVTYPLVPGLTNLFGQLGLNSNVFLFEAALEQGPLRGLAFHLLAGLFLCALVVRIVHSYVRVLGGHQENVADYFIIPLAVPSIVWVLNADIVGTNTDLPTGVISLVGLIALFDLVQEYPKDGEQTKLFESRFIVATSLFVLIITFKMTALVLAMLAWSLALLRLALLNISRERRRTLILASIGLSCALAIPWVLRGVVLSGYPFFPSSAFAFPVDWRVPREIADSIAHFGRSWARLPHASFGETNGVHWMLPWFGAAIKNRVDFQIPALFSLTGLVLALRHGTFKNLSRFWLLVPSFGGLVFWFMLAPAFRFGEAAIWATAACLGSVALQLLLPAMSQIQRRAVLVGIAAIGIWCSYPRTLYRVYFRPLLEAHGFSHIPEVRTVPYQLSSGLTVNVPIRTNQCWDADLPCSPYFLDELRLRRDASPRWGFRIERPITSLNMDKFTPLHRMYVSAKSTDGVCSNCHLTRPIMDFTTIGGGSMFK
jgi:hypothetical protein